MCWPHSGAGPPGVQRVSLKSTGVATPGAVAAVGLRDVDERARGVHLRVVEGFRRRLHRRPPHAGRVEAPAPLLGGLGGEDGVEQRDQLADVVAPRLHGGEAGIGEPFGSRDGAHEVGPVPLALQTEEPEPPAVAGRGTDMMTGFGISFRTMGVALMPSRSAAFVSQPSTKSPTRRSDVVTSCPRPVRSRASKAALTPPASVIPAV